MARRFDTMAPKNIPRWLVVQDQYGNARRIELLPPGTDPRMVMLRQMAKSIGMGWEVEELPDDVPSTLPMFFCRKDSQRNKVMIVEREPAPSA